jgi:hypothetical protein
VRRPRVCGQNLVRDDRTRDREQRQNRYNGHGFHNVNVTWDCGRKRQTLAHFHDQGRNNHGGVACRRDEAKEAERDSGGNIIPSLSIKRFY